MTTIEYQAGDALLHVVNAYLKGDMWSERVYNKRARESVKDNFDLWVVCRVVSDVPRGYRADRDNRVLELRVQAVSKESEPAELAAGRIYDLLHLSGVNDRRAAVSIGTHDEWTFLSVEAGRAIRVVPNKAAGLRFFENGYAFEVVMEAKNGYV